MCYSSLCLISECRFGDSLSQEGSLKPEDSLYHCGPQPPAAAQRPVNSPLSPLLDQDLGLVLYHVCANITGGEY